MQKLLIVLFCSLLVTVFPSCKKTNTTPAEPKPAGILLTITRQKNIATVSVYKYAGSTVVDSTIIPADVNKKFFINHKWLNKNKLMIVNTNAGINEEVLVKNYQYAFQQQNNNISETLLVEFSFLGKAYKIDEVNRVAELTLF